MTLSNATAPRDRPSPIIDATSRGFWEAASHGELAIQRCGQCRRLQHPPRPVCPECGATDLMFERMSGDATLLSWTMTHRSVLEQFDDAAPYLCILVELVEQSGLVLASDYAGIDVDPAELRVGAAMRVTFPAAGEQVTVLPQFRLMRGSGAVD